MGTLIAIIALVAIFSGFRLSISVRSGKTSKHPDILVPPRGLGGYVADDENIPNPKLLVPTRHGGGQSNSALLALIKSIEARIPKDEPLKSDDAYFEPQATYPLEMEQEH